MFAFFPPFTIEFLLLESLDVSPAKPAAFDACNSFRLLGWITVL